jgi:hypothetical protein
MYFFLKKKQKKPRFLQEPEVCLPVPGYKWSAYRRICQAKFYNKFTIFKLVMYQAVVDNLDF